MIDDPSVAPDYPTKCLVCGADLDIIALDDGQTPPWGCGPCGRAYWPAELRAAVEHDDLFDPVVGWASDTRTHVMLAAVEGERLSSIERGTSLLPEQLHMLDDATLTYWRSRRLSAEMAEHVDRHLQHRAENPKPKRKRATPRKG